MKKLLLPLMYFAITSLQAQVQAPLYTGKIPGSKAAPAGFVEFTDERGFVKSVSEPGITVWVPEKKSETGSAVIIFPGGGYGGLSMINEGSSIAKAFNKIGVTAFVVKYRLPDDRIMNDKKTGPLQDAQQAIWYVRKNAATWGIDPNWTGIIGFSAGGHLASTAGTHFDKNYIGNTDSISLVPSFMILIYPVISFGPLAHVGSRENLLGKSPDADAIRSFSNETRITAKTPPTFLVHATDDDVVDVKNSLVFYDSLQAWKIPSEIHIYEKGGHGYGLNNPSTDDKWFDRCAAWLKVQGFR
ncbi:MAG: alpha/beta hydrolase [Chitinophagaceae bacterium]